MSYTLLAIAFLGYRYYVLDTKGEVLGQKMTEIYLAVSVVNYVTNMVALIIFAVLFKRFRKLYLHMTQQRRMLAHSNQKLQQLVVLVVTLLSLTFAIDSVLMNLLKPTAFYLYQRNLRSERVSDEFYQRVLEACQMGL